MSETAINTLAILALVAVMMLNIYVKYQRSKKTPLGRVASILMDINHNVKFVDSFSYHRQGGRMKTRAWNKYQDKIEYVPQPITSNLSRLFEMCEEVNGRISDARKHKSDSYMAGIDIHKVEGPLHRSQEELREWLQENMKNPEFQPKKKGLLGGLFKGIAH